MPSPGDESIGSMFSGIGIFSAAIYPQFVYILWIAKPCATISTVGKSDSQNSTPRPHPSLGKLAQAGFPLFPGMPLGALRPEPRYELGAGRLQRAGDGFRLRGFISTLLNIRGRLCLRLMCGHLCLCGGLLPRGLQRRETFAGNFADPVLRAPRVACGLAVTGAQAVAEPPA